MFASYASPCTSTHKKSKRQLSTLTASAVNVKDRMVKDLLQEAEVIRMTKSILSQKEPALMVWNAQKEMAQSTGKDKLCGLIMLRR